MLTLTIRTSPQAAPRAIVLDREHVTLGRAASCDLQIPSPTISSHHLTFTRRGPLMCVSDAGSTNGTLLNGERLRPGEAVVLPDLATLQILDVRLEVAYAQRGGAGFTLAESATLLRALVGDALREDAREDRPFFEPLGGPRQGQRQHLPLDTAEVWLMPDGTLAREAATSGARVTLGAGLPSAHAPESGTLLCQGQPVLASAPRSLHSRDRLQLGAATFIFFDPLQDFLAALDGPSLQPPPGPSPTRAPPAPQQAAPDDSPLEGAPDAPDVSDPPPRASETSARARALRYGLLALVLICVAASAMIFLALMGALSL